MNVLVNALNQMGGQSNPAAVKVYRGSIDKRFPTTLPNGLQGAISPADFAACIEAINGLSFDAAQVMGVAKCGMIIGIFASMGLFMSGMPLCFAAEGGFPCPFLAFTIIGFISFGLQPFLWMGGAQMYLQTKEKALLALVREQNGKTGTQNVSFDLGYSVSNMGYINRRPQTYKVWHVEVENKLAPQGPQAAVPQAACAMPQMPAAGMMGGAGMYGMPVAGGYPAAGGGYPVQGPAAVATAYAAPTAVGMPPVVTVAGTSVPEGVATAAAVPATGADGGDLASQLEQLGKLRAAGVLSEAEFAAAKERVLTGPKL